MTQYIMTAKDIEFVHTNLEFSLRYPLYKTVSAALDRFHELQSFVDSLEKTQQNKDMIFKCFNECDFILNTLEGYDL